MKAIKVAVNVSKVSVFRALDVASFGTIIAAVT